MTMSAFSMPTEYSICHVSNFFYGDNSRDQNGTHFSF